MHKQGPPPPGFMPPPAYSDGMPMSPQYPPPAPAPQVIVMQNVQFGPDPQTVTCPDCHATGTSVITTEASMKTHIIALLLCLFACWPCAPCVYCCDSCLVKKHSCPNCNRYLGTYDH